MEENIPNLYDINYPDFEVYTDPYLLPHINIVVLPKTLIDSKLITLKGATMM